MGQWKQSRRRNSWVVLVSLVCLLFVEGGSVARAATKLSGTVPSGKLSESGLSAEFESVGIKKTGYRAIDVKVTCRPATVADREVVIYMQPKGQNYGYKSRSPSVRCILEIPEGGSQATQRVLVPLVEEWQTMEVTVYDDGHEVEDMTTTMSFIRTGTSSHWQTLTETYPGWLFIDADVPELRENAVMARGSFGKLPNIRRISEFFPAYTEFQHELIQDIGGEQLNDQEILETVDKLETIEILGLESLPTNWLEYSPYDIAVVSLEDLQRLQRSEQERWESLLKFVRTGGNLIVFGTGAPQERFGRIAELEQLVGLKSENVSAGEKESRWELPSVQSYDRELRTLLPEVYHMSNTGSFNVQSPQSFRRNVPPRLKNYPKSMFVTSSFGMGRIIAVTNKDPFSVSRRQWHWLVSSLGENRWKWYQRHGMSLARDNDGFWDFIIKGVGAAPVIAFLVLITAFVVAIGPLNYLALQRWQRMYLILFTVPVGALVVTVGLLMYAFIGDGISTRARHRSFTMIDANGNATSWSRQTYYAGLPVSKGLSFPASAAVYPILYQPNSERRDFMLRWEDGKQKLVKGYVTARSLAQFLVIESKKSSDRVAVKKSGSGLEATNELGTDLKYLFVFNPDEKKFYFAEGIAKGDTAKLQATEIENARLKLNDAIKFSTIAVPPGFDFPQSRRRYWDNTDSQERSASTSTSLLEKGIGELRYRQAPKQRIYYAISELKPNAISIGAKSSEEPGFHMVKGEW